MSYLNPKQKIEVIDKIADYLHGYMINPAATFERDEFCVNGLPAEKAAHLVQVLKYNKVDAVLSEPQKNGDYILTMYLGDGYEIIMQKIQEISSILKQFRDNTPILIPPPSKENYTASTFNIQVLGRDDMITKSGSEITLPPKVDVLIPPDEGGQYYTLISANSGMNIVKFIQVLNYVYHSDPKNQGTLAEKGEGGVIKFSKAIESEDVLELLINSKNQIQAI
ncbi:MAG: hypothetical protein KDD76_00575 [Rickettsiales bacterium]|nr:hypothetical protein [Rickettsiales bacterium]